jgi:hypothetical protein
MRCIIIFALWIFSTWGCSSPKVGLDELKMRQNKYYFGSSQKPYSGKIISKYDNGYISNIIEMKDGIPNGKWVVYGYKKEIIQEGFYNPITVSNEADFFKNSIKRLNVCTTKEGEVEFKDILIITDASDKKELGDEKSKILAFLRSHSMIVNGDTINEIKYVRGELEN